MLIIWLALIFFGGGLRERRAFALPGISIFQTFEIRTERRGSRNFSH